MSVPPDLGPQPPAGGQGGAASSVYAPSRPPREGLLYLLLLGFAVLFALGSVLGGEAGQFAAAGLQVAPLILLLALWQLSADRPAARWVAWVWFWLILLGYAGMVVVFTAAGAGADAGPALTPAQAGSLALSLLVVLATLLVAVALLVTRWWVPLGRALGARVTGTHWWHAQGLVGLIALSILSLVPLVALGGQPPLLLLIAQGEPPGLDRTSEQQVLDLFYTLAWTIPVALLGAGWPVRRTLRAGIARLGMLPVGLRLLPVLVLMSAGLVAFSFALDGVVQTVWERTGWPVTDAEAVAELFEALESPVGAISIGVSAGVGEELLVRGLLQPRFGWFVPNVAFTAAHAFQYGWDGLISVFAIGAFQAAVRARWNTTAAAITHGLYNFFLVLGGVLGLPGF